MNFTVYHVILKSLMIRLDRAAKYPNVTETLLVAEDVEDDFLSRYIIAV